MSVSRRSRPPGYRPLGHIDRPFVSRVIRLQPSKRRPYDPDRPLGAVQAALNRLLIEEAYVQAVQLGEIETARSLYPTVAVEVFLDSALAPPQDPTAKETPARRPTPPPESLGGRDASA